MTNFKRIASLLLLLAATALTRTVQAQDVALKTNALYWATTTPNLGLEFALKPRYTLELAAAYNPWTFKDDKKMRFWLVQPEARYWFCEKFEGHFVGLHLHGAQFYGGFKDKRYDGYLAGGGLTYGYDWILSPHWNLEAAIGIGYAYIWYKESPRIHCVKCQTDKHKNYFHLVCDPVKSVTLEENISTTSGEDFYDLTEAMKDVNGWDDFTKMKAAEGSSDEDIITIINYFFGCGLWGLGHINDELEDHSLQEFPFSITRPNITTDNVALIWELVKENNP